MKAQAKKETNKKLFGKPKQPTGIKGFDEVLEGGLPEGRSTLINGGTGTGKTVFLNEFLYRGITKYNQPGVFVTFEERPEYIKENVAKFGWDYDKLEKENKLVFVDLSPDYDVFAVDSDKNYDLTPILQRILYAIKKVNAKRVAIDNLGRLYEMFDNRYMIRQIVLKIAYQLNSLGMISLISSETETSENKLSKFGVEEFAADAVISLELDWGDQSFVRKVFVRKMRGASFRSGKVEYEISSNGIEVFPKIPVDNHLAEIDLSTRMRFNIPGLDEAMNGGIPQGHIMLLSGNTGTGKSIISLHFVFEGIKNGENGVIVALEEPIPQIKRAAKSMGWDLQKYEDEGKLRFVTTPLIDISPDKLLYKILAACKEINAKRVVIDSISSIQSATFDKDKVRQFLIQLAGFFKKEGITSVCNFLSGSNFGASKDQLLSSLETNSLKLSSIMDGVILLLYVERDQKVERLITILKLRGSNHKKGIFTFHIDKNGAEVTEIFKK